MLELESFEDTQTLKATLEAFLLVSSEAATAQDFADVLGIEAELVQQALQELADEYARCNRGIQLKEVAGGWRLFTHPMCHEQVEALVCSWDTRRLSQAALETLSIIAYQQPVSREGVKAIRGVNSDGVISSLIDKGLVKEVARDKNHGQMRLFGTTKAFLERFGLRSLKDLPDLEQFVPDEQSRQFIRERLSARPQNLQLDELAEDLDEEKDLLDDVDSYDDESLDHD